MELCEKKIVQKRNLFIANIGVQLMYAIQIKAAKQIGEDSDIILIKSKNECEIDSENLKYFFNEVYFSVNSVPVYKGLDYCLRPEKALEEIYAVGMDPNIYTDIFYLGESWVYYFLYKYYSKNKINIDWHIYPDGIGQYMLNDDRYEVKIYGRNVIIQNIINFIDKNIYKYGQSNINAVRDLYLIGAEYAIDNLMYSVVDVPKFDCKDQLFIERLKAVFKYSQCPMRNAIVWVDEAVSGNRNAFEDANGVDQFLINIESNVDKEVIIKVKQGVAIEEYSDEVRDKIGLLINRYPFELILLSGDLSDSLVISSSSGVVLLSEIMGIKSSVDYILIRDSHFIRYKIKCEENIEIINKVCSDKVKQVYSTEELLDGILLY